MILALEMLALLPTIPGHTTPIQTPHLDQMASESIELLNFYSIGPVCSPTRGSFFRKALRTFWNFRANEGFSAKKFH